jgi:hypothetical protein
MTGTKLLATVKADLFRQDLLNIGRGNGSHGFVYPTPTSLKDGQPHTITVRFAGTTRALSSAPKTLNAGTMADRLAALERAAASSEAKLLAKDGQINTQKQQIASLQSKLVHFSRSGNEVFLSGANLHIVNGQGGTDTINGLGNLIVGYNEARGDGTDNRTGSHNLVVGNWNNYSSFGGLVGGRYNEISGAYASVSGGDTNTASDYAASVSGGFGNTASGELSSVSGGASNTASGPYASVSGGNGRSAWEEYDWWAGGLFQDF